MSTREKICHRCPFHYASYFIMRKKDDIIWWFFAYLFTWSTSNNKVHEFRLSIIESENTANLSCTFKDLWIYCVCELVTWAHTLPPTDMRFSQFKMFRICILLNYMWLIINVKRQWCWKFLKRFIIFIFPKLLYMQILMSLLWQIMFSFFITQKSFQLLVNLSLENKILWFFSSWLFFMKKKKMISKITSKSLEHFFKYSAPSSFSDLTQMKIF